MRTGGGGEVGLMLTVQFELIHSIFERNNSHVCKMLVHVLAAHQTDRHQSHSHKICLSALRNLTAPLPL